MFRKTSAGEFATGMPSARGTGLLVGPLLRSARVTLQFVCPDLPIRRLVPVLRSKESELGAHEGCQPLHPRARHAKYIGSLLGGRKSGINSRSHFSWNDQRLHGTSCFNTTILPQSVLAVVSKKPRAATRNLPSSFHTAEI